MPHHRFLRAAAARRVLPDLSSRVKVIAQYYDARIVHPERLTLELAADAERDCPGAAALPYVSAIGVEGGQVLLQDEISGDVLRVRPEIIVNAAGAWADGVDEAFGLADRLIGGTKGSHLVLRAPGLADSLGERMILFRDAGASDLPSLCARFPSRSAGDDR